MTVFSLMQVSSRLISLLPHNSLESADLAVIEIMGDGCERLESKDFCHKNDFISR